jgi:hypothetical protein
MKQAPERSPLRKELIAPRQFLLKQLEPSVMIMKPGNRHLGAYHEHKCLICGRRTTGVGNSLCPKTHAPHDLMAFRVKQDKNNTLTNHSSAI